VDPRLLHLLLWPFLTNRGARMLLLGQVPSATIFWEEKGGIWPREASGSTAARRCGGAAQGLSWADLQPGRQQFLLTPALAPAPSSILHPKRLSQTRIAAFSSLFNTFDCLIVPLGLGLSIEVEISPSIFNGSLQFDNEKTCLKRYINLVSTGKKRFWWKRCFLRLILM